LIYFFNFSASASRRLLAFQIFSFGVTLNPAFTNLFVSALCRLPSFSIFLFRHYADYRFFQISSFGIAPIANLVFLIGKAPQKKQIILKAML